MIYEFSTERARRIGEIPTLPACVSP